MRDQFFSTLDEMLMAVNRVDKIIRPYAIACPPHYSDALEKELGEAYKIISTPTCPEDRCYLINREDFEKNFGGEKDGE